MSEILKISDINVSFYLKELVNAKLLKAKKIGRTPYYTNYKLMELLSFG